MPTISTNFVLGGEKEYRQAISNINAGMKVLDSEMKLAQSRFEDQADSVEALTAKNDVLERQISTQREKIATLRQALEQAAQTYGEGSEKTMRWQTSLNNAEAELNKMNSQLDNNRRKMEEQVEQTEELDEKTAGLGSEISGIASKLGFDVPSAVTDAMASFDKMGNSSVALKNWILALVAAIVALVKGLESVTKGAGEAADELGTLSMQTGLTVEELQEFQYASELIDVSVDTLQGSLTKLTNNMQDARDGSGSAAEAFETLRVKVQGADGELRNAKDVFYEVIDALGDVQNSTERDALAMDIFGRSAQDLNPLIVQGSEKLQDFAAEARSTGYVLDELSVTKLAKVDDSFKRLQSTYETMQKKLAVEFAPYVVDGLDKLTGMVEKLDDALNESGIADTLGQILSYSIDMLEPLLELTVDILPVLQPLLKGVAGSAALIADAVQLLLGVFGVSTIYGVLTGQGLDYGGHQTLQALGAYPQTDPSRYQQWLNSTQHGLDWDGSRWVAQNPTSYNYVELEAMYNDYLNSYHGSSEYIMTFEEWLEDFWSHHATGTDNFPGGFSWVGENGPELVYMPQGTRIKTAQESEKLAGNVTYNITIDAKNVKEFNDIVRIAKSRRRLGRMEGDNAWQ